MSLCLLLSEHSLFFVFIAVFRLFIVSFIMSVPPTKEYKLGGISFISLVLSVAISPVSSAQVGS